MQNSTDEKKEAPISALAANGAQPRLQKFGSVEHREAGNRAFKSCIEQPEFKEIKAMLRDLFLYEPVGGALTLYAPSGQNFLRLSAGEWVALGGDFYGVPDQPIALEVRHDETTGLQLRPIEDLEERKPRFEAAYQTLAGIAELTGQAYHEAKATQHKLLQGIEREREIVETAQKRGDSVKEALIVHASELDKYYGLATMVNNDIWRHLPFGYVRSAYVALAQYNFDHFGKEAERAYEAGHAVALATAAAAHGIEDKESRARLLVRALTQELFACHFLTDLFAAGHMRTPRKALVEHVHQRMGHSFVDDNTTKMGVAAGLLAQAMHDEDNHEGLEVSSEQHPDPWPAYGDHCYYEQASDANNTQMEAAVVAALGSVMTTFKGEETSYDFTTYIPVPTANNRLPLFLVEASAEVVKKRLKTPKTDKNGVEQTHDDQWSPTFFLAKKNGDEFVQKKWEDIKAVREEIEATATEVVEKTTTYLKGNCSVM